jgi:drug/metabolite transporter (DMT)-like permease
MNSATMSPLRQAIIALAFLSVIWGYNWITMKQAMLDAGPLNFSAFRFGIGGLALIPAIFFLKQSFAIPRREWRTVALLSFLLVLNFGFVMTALIVGGAGKISVLVYTMPFWGLILARIVLHERLKRWQWWAVALAFVGQIVLIDPFHQQRNVLSSILAVLAGLLWAASVIVVKNMQHRANVPMVTLTFWQTSVAAIGFVLAGFIVPQKSITWTPLLVWCIFYSAVIATSVAWLLFYYALKRMPASLAGLSTLATPVFGVLFGWAVLGERPTGLEAIGMGLIGVALGTLALVPVAIKRFDPS